MKLLFDANLSPKLVKRLAGLFPGSAHLFETGLAANTSDAEIWAYARDKGFTIVSADNDFVELSKTQGMPPNVVLLAGCDYKTSLVEELLRKNAIRISSIEESGIGCLVIRRS